MAKLILTLILLITLHGFAMSDANAVSKYVEDTAKPDADGMTCLQLGFAEEYFMIDHQTYPLAGYCHMKKVIKNENIKLTEKQLEVAVSPFFRYEVNSLNDMTPSRELKALGKAIAVVKSDQMKTNEDTVVEIHTADKDIEELNALFKKANIKINIPLKSGFKYYIGSTKVEQAKAVHPMFWLAQYVKAGMNNDDWLKIAFSVGVFRYKKNDRIFNVMVVSDMKRNQLLKITELAHYMEAHINDIKSSVEDIEKFNSLRTHESSAFEDYAVRCAKTIEAEQNVNLTRGRPAFNPYNMIGELQLMRQYPQVVYHWLNEDPEFKKNSPHADKILAYLKDAPQRSIGQRCVLRDMCPWTYAYIQAVHGVKKFDKFAALDINYYDHDFGMLTHLKSRLKMWTAHGYEVNSVYPNDFGAYDIITHVLFNDKDPKVWEHLIKDDVHGVDNLAFATSKNKNKWNISLVYYETLESKNCPPNYFTKRDIGFQSCLNKYNFYQRRWHDYDWTKGVVRNPGDGETKADEPFPEDQPGDNENMPEKKPLVPLPIIPKVVVPVKKPETVIPKPVVPVEEPKKKDPIKKPVVPKIPTPKPPGTPKTKQDPTPKKPLPPKNKPKDHTKTPEQIRRKLDEDYMNKIRANLDDHQVISLKREYTWLHKEMH